jgi:alpha-galactosidase
MSQNIRTVIIGGASVTWMAIFMKDLVACASMEGGTIVLQDLSLPGLEKMKRFSEKLVSERGKSIRIEIEQDLERAITGADFVINTVLVGSHDAWLKEQNIIKAHGLQHPKGMSVGPGGMMMGIKQIPFVLDLARRMEKLAPDAWLFNFANPMQLLMLAVQRFVPNVKTIGICHGVKGTLEIIAKRVGIPEQELSYVAGGINHFEIIKSITHDGRDVFPLYLEKLAEIDAKDGYCGEWIPREMYQLFGGYPSNHDIHVIEFLPHYIHKGTDVQEFHQIFNAIEGRMKSRSERWAKFDAYIAGASTFEDLQAEGTEYLDHMIDAVVKNEPYMLYGQVTNRGYIPNLPDDVAIGVPVLLSRDHYIGTCIGPLPRGLAEFSAIHGAVQNFMVEAAMTGDRQKLLAGLSLDPMCYTLTLAERKSLIDELLEASKEYLPLFFE